MDTRSASQMKVTIELLNRNSNQSMARRMVIGSIMEYTTDKSTNMRLLCEMLPSPSRTGLVYCSNKDLPQIDGQSAVQSSWAQLLNLPQHDHKYHGECLLSNIALLKTMSNMDCGLQVFLDSSLRYPKCNPYVIVYGLKQAQVINATEAVKRAMRHHQRK